MQKYILVPESETQRHSLKGNGTRDNTKQKNKVAKNLSD